MSRTVRTLALSILLLAPLPVAAAGELAPLAPGIQLFEAKKYEEARKYFAPRAAASAEAAFYLGRTLIALRQFAKASETLEKAVALAPSDAEAHFWLGRAYGQEAMESNLLKQAGLAKKTKAEFEKAVELDPGHLGARGDLVQYYLLAPGFMGGSVDKAREQAAEIKKRDAVRGSLALVNVHLDQKDTGAAERELRAAIQTAPADLRPRLLLGAVYQDLKRWNDAFEAFEAAAKASPPGFDALYQIGKTGVLSGQRLDRAEECLKRYLGSSPGPESAPLPNAHFRLGQVYEKKGDKARARAHYQQAVKMDPNLKDAREALKKL
jgi:tetratricopeptide (TPR) repeat protein